MRRCHKFALVCLPALASFAHADILSHWRFDETKGTTAADSAGSAHGALMGGASFSPDGISGGALSLSAAANSFVMIGDVYAFGSGDAFTIQAWIRVPPSVTQNVFPVGRHSAGTVNGYMLGINSSGGAYGAPGKAWFYTSDFPGGEPISTTTVTDDQWHQIVGTFTPAGLSRIYVDGAPVEDSRSAGGLGANNAPLLIGGLLVGSNPTGLFTGLIDDVQIYCGVLTDEQIQFLFDNPGAEIPRCPANWNRDCSVNSQDFFDFLTDFFANDADFNNDATTNSQDFFDFLGSFFGGC